MLFRHFFLRVDRIYRALRHTDTAIDAFVRIDEIHVVAWHGVNAFDRTHVRARTILYAYAGLGNDVGHGAYSRHPPPSANIADRLSHHNRKVRRGR